MAQNPSLSPAEAIVILEKLGAIGKWLQAIGFVVILWIVWYVISWILSQRKLKELNTIKQNLHRIERKIDALTKKKR